MADLNLDRKMAQEVEGSPVRRILGKDLPPYPEAPKPETGRTSRLVSRHKDSNSGGGGTLGFY